MMIHPYEHKVIATYYLIATVTGSYGETGQMRIGRDQPTLERAVTQARQHKERRGFPEVCIYERGTQGTNQRSRLVEVVK